MIPSFRSVFFPEKQEIHYIGGTDILPLPLSSEEEGHAISLLEFFICSISPVEASTEISAK